MPNSNRVALKKCDGSLIRWQHDTSISASPSGTQGPFLATRNSYDGSGNLSTVEAGQLASWQSESIAPASWASFTTDRTTSYSYDSYGRKTREQLYAGTISAGQVTAVTQYSYDLYGRVVCAAVRMDPSQWGGQPDACVPQTTGPNGPDRITKTSYDYLGDITLIERAVGTPLQQNYETFTWDATRGGAGKPATMADANGNLTSYTYSGTGLNLLTQWSFPSATTVGQSSSIDYEAYAYDANGNRTSLRKRDSVTITYLYDALNRVTQKSVPASATGAAGYSVFYDYDLGGRPLYARFGSASGAGGLNQYTAAGTASFTYDANAKLISDGTNSYVYDTENRLVSATRVVNGVTTTVATLAYDPDGRLWQVSGH